MAWAQKAMSRSVEADLRLEPLAFVVDQRDRRLADAGGKLGQVVERLFRAGVEDLVELERAQPLDLVRWQGEASASSLRVHWRKVSKIESDLSGCGRCATQLFQRVFGTLSTLSVAAGV